MRLALFAAVTGSACFSAAPAEPLADVPLASERWPLPPYGGAKWTSLCAVQLEPASAGERAERIAAMETWLPGAKIELSALGDRARIIELPSHGPAPHRPREAELLGRHLAELAAPLFGAGTVGYPQSVETRAAWILDMKAITSDFTRRQGAREVAVVVRIERATGAIRIGLADEIVPIMPACEHVPPPIDNQRVIAAVIAHPQPRGSTSPITEDDMAFSGSVEAAPSDDGRSSHGVIRVAVAPHLASRIRGTTLERSARVVHEIVDVDAATYEVVGYEADGGSRPLDDWITLNPLADAKRAFGPTQQPRFRGP